MQTITPPPEIFGIGHGVVFPDNVVVRNASTNENVSLIGKFVIYGRSMHSVPFEEDPNGLAFADWADHHLGEQSAALPILECSILHGDYLWVGVPEDSRYTPANFRFHSIGYNDHIANAFVSASVGWLIHSEFVGGTCAPLAAYTIPRPNRSSAHSRNGR